MILRRLRERFGCWRRGHLLEPDGVLARGSILTFVQCSHCGRGFVLNDMMPGFAIEMPADRLGQRAAEFRAMLKRMRENLESTE